MFVLRGRQKAALHLAPVARIATGGNAKLAQSKSLFRTDPLHQVAEVTHIVVKKYHASACESTAFSESSGPNIESLHSSFVCSFVPRGTEFCPTWNICASVL